MEILNKYIEYQIEKGLLKNKHQFSKRMNISYQTLMTILRRKDSGISARTAKKLVEGTNRELKPQDFGFNDDYE